MRIMRRKKIKERRKVYKLGGSRAITLPKELKVGDTTTMASGSVLILADTTGKISEDDLERFLIEVMEPMFWDWYRYERKLQ